MADGVEGVFFLKLSQKLTPLEIKLEKFRFRFSPNRGLKRKVQNEYLIFVKESLDINHL